MLVSELQANKLFLPQVEQFNNLTEAKPKDTTFVDTLNELIGDVNNAQKESKDLNDRFVKGEPVDLHNVMIASEKAKTTFQLLMELRNKFVDTYREVMRTQV